MLKNTDKNINCSVCIFTSEIWILLRAHKAYRRGGKLPHGAYVWAILLCLLVAQRASLRQEWDALKQRCECHSIAPIRRILCPVPKRGETLGMRHHGWHGPIQDLWPSPLKCWCSLGKGVVNWCNLPYHNVNIFLGKGLWVGATPAEYGNQQASWA